MGGSRGSPGRVQIRKEERGNGEGEQSVPASHPISPPLPPFSLGCCCHAWRSWFPCQCRVLLLPLCMLLPPSSPCCGDGLSPLLCSSLVFSSFSLPLFFLSFFMILGMELGTSYMLGKCSTTVLHIPPVFLLLFLMTF